MLDGVADICDDGGSARHDRLRTAGRGGVRGVWERPAGAPHRPLGGRVVAQSDRQLRGAAVGVQARRADLDDAGDARHRPRERLQLG